MGIPISIVILTHNEEQNIGDCLSSLTWCEDIHVVDSGSVDNTLLIAKENGATTYSHPFESFGLQRNWSLDNCDLKHKWVLFLDADERSTEEFKNALLSSIENATNDTAGFYCCWKTILSNTWIKRSDGFPRWQFRFLYHGKARFEDFGHSQKGKIVEGTAEYIKEPYLHFPYNKGWDEWWDRHNRYSQKEAKARLENPLIFKDLFSSNLTKRVTSLKTLVSKVPGWPFIYFLIRYIFQLGFLDGRAGLTYCINMAYYEHMIRLKMKEYKMKKESNI